MNIVYFFYLKNKEQDVVNEKQQALEKKKRNPWKLKMCSIKVKKEIKGLTT